MILLKKYLTDELGDAKKAQQAFDESILPKARKTYNIGTNHQALSSGLTGLVGGGIGLGVAKAIKNKNQSEE